MTQLQAELFTWGLIGSLAVQVIKMKVASDQPRRLPARFKKVSFWVIQLLVAFLGGTLVVAYNVDNHVLALHIGAATPLIIQSFSDRSPMIPSKRDNIPLGNAAAADPETV